jgi:molybdate transport system substrate-binding protein
MAVRSVVAELAVAYEARARRSVTVEAVGGVDAVRRIEAGARYDFIVLAADAIDRLAASGFVDPGTRIDVARSRIAVAVQAAAPRPDIGSEAAVRAAMLAARSIGYSTGPSGRHLAQLIERWKLGDALRGRLIEAPPGVSVGTLIARGDVEIGFQQASELIDVPGIDVVGFLPAEIQQATVFAAAAGIGTDRADAVRAWLAFLASPEADATKLRHAMEPA